MLTNIPLTQNISNNIFEKLDKPQTNISCSDLLNNKLKIRKYYDMCLLHCKTQVFDLPYINDKILLNGHEMRCKSISMIAETLKVLRVDLGYDDEFVSIYIYTHTSYKLIRYLNVNI